MSQSLEHDSDEQSSSQNTEYHSELEFKSEEKQIILIDDSEEYTFLNIQFPLPYEFPKVYLVLNEVVSNLDDALPKPYIHTHDSIKDPSSALGYIIRHSTLTEYLTVFKTFLNTSSIKSTTRLTLIPHNTHHSNASLT